MDVIKVQATCLAHYNAKAIPPPLAKQAQRTFRKRLKANAVLRQTLRQGPKSAPGASETQEIGLRGPSKRGAFAPVWQLME